MKINLLILFALFLALPLLSANNITTQDGILLLNEKIFAKPLNKHPFVLILFYDSTASDNTITEFVEVGNQLRELYSGVKLARIDGPTNKTRTEMYKVSSYPALRLFIKDGYVPETYEGEFKPKAIIDWMTSKLEAQIGAIESIKEADDLITGEENVAFYFGLKNATAYSYLLDAISNFNDEDVVFAWASDAKILEHFELVPDDTSLIMFRDYDEERSVYPVPFTAEGIRAFLNSRRHPAVMPFNVKALTRLNDKKEDGIILFQAANENKKAGDMFKAVAGEFRDMIAFIEVSGSQKNQIGKKFDLAQFPAVGIVGPGNKRYLLDRAISEKNIKVFLANYFQDNLVPYEKREPKINREGFDGDLKVLDKANYKDVVLKGDYDVLVEFYHPECGHCIHFAPKYAALATKLRGVDGLMLGKFDSTKPRPPGVSIKYYPMLMFYPKGKKNSPIVYEGNRDEKDLIRFIKKHATVPMKGF